MAFQGILEVDSIKFNILSMDLNFSQQMDSTGKPSANPAGGAIHLTIDSSKNSSFLMQWMLTADSVKDVTIIFAGFTLDQPRKLKLQKAFCVGYHENFDAAGSNSMQTMLTLTAHKFESGEAVMDKDWNKIKSN